MGLIKYTIDYYAYGVALLLSRGFVLALPELWRNFEGLY